MRASDLGEFGLIDRLARRLSPRPEGSADRRLIAGIGDDAAVWRTDGGAILATTDTLVSGVHFLAECPRWRDIGWKSIAVNVSDIAAMGGSPEFALVTLGLAPDEAVESLDELYGGLDEACEAFGVEVVGGDIVKSPVPFVSVTMTGRARLDHSGEPQVLRRSAAEAGDLIAVTGTLGGSAAGLRCLRDGKNESEVASALAERHLRPVPRIEAGRAALDAGIRCAIDVSDGLMQDLGHVCKASRVGAVVWSGKLPIDAGIGELFSRDEALGFAAGGGEDYELLFAGTREHVEAVARAGDVPVTVIGEFVIASEHRPKLLDQSGREIALAATGWDHLSSGL